MEGFPFSHKTELLIVVTLQRVEKELEIFARRRLNLPWVSSPVEQDGYLFPLHKNKQKLFKKTSILLRHGHFVVQLKKQRMIRNSSNEKGMQGRVKTFLTWHHRISWIRQCFSHSFCIVQNLLLVLFEHWCLCLEKKQQQKNTDRIQNLQIEVMKIAGLISQLPTCLSATPTPAIAWLCGPPWRDGNTAKSMFLSKSYIISGTWSRNATVKFSSSYSFVTVLYIFLCWPSYLILMTSKFDQAKIFEGRFSFKPPVIINKWSKKVNSLFRVSISRVVKKHLRPAI